MNGSGWQTVHFGDVARNIKEIVDPDTSGLERYIAGEHMDTDDLKLRRWGTVGDGYLGPAFHMKFTEGQILYGSRRTYLRKVAVADFDGICSNTTFVIEAIPEKIYPPLLPFIMQSEPFTQHSMQKSRGSTNPYIVWSDIACYEFPLPPLDEQRRIAEILWAVEKTIERFKNVENLTGHIQASFVADYVKEYSETHELIELQDLIEPNRPICYGILKPGLPFEGGIPVIKVKDYPDGYIRMDDLLLTDPEIDKQYTRSKLNEGDLLLSIRGTMGRLAEVPAQLQDANITQDTARLSIRPLHNRHYIRAMLESDFVQKQIQRAVTGLAVKGINIGEVRKICLPVPSQSEQNDFASKFNQVNSTISAATNHVERTISLKQRLLSEIL